MTTMRPDGLLRLRLINHRLVGSTLRTPLEVVSHLGAVQAQDYGSAKWGVGLRAPGLTSAGVDAALDEGTIVRTHVLRPTWHFVAPADLRWMLALSAPRIRKAMGSYLRRLGLTERVLAKSRRTIERALTGHRSLTRAELVDVLRRSGVAVDGLRPNFLTLDAEIEGVVCSGPRRGKQHTYALIEERIPEGRRLEGDAALGELARTYFPSHGPATLRDFGWWSGLAARDARHAVEMNASSLQRATLNGLTYWFVDDAGPRGKFHPPTVHLVPDFDEYLVAYQDRRLIVDGDASPIHLRRARGDLLSAVVIVNGKVIGTWKRSVQRNALSLEISLSSSVEDRVRRAIRRTVTAYGDFSQTPARCSIDR
ncbi:MAG TPA: winged helix DNA-binding domain-containing protein [Vicinamibacterales bacterium]|jgi:hypothetical protein|nr:winged helix DNA-binding domain-containing protein [Vicinamibacterales bacterium]